MKIKAKWYSYNHRLCEWYVYRSCKYNLECESLDDINNDILRNNIPIISDNRVYNRYKNDLIEKSSIDSAIRINQNNYEEYRWIWPISKDCLAITKWYSNQTGDILILTKI